MQPQQQPAETPDPADRAASDRRDALVREIRAAGDAADSPLEVYRAALAGVTTALDATFASVFLRDENEPHLLRLACAQNWPQSSARFLSDLRIRSGRGPSGRAVAENRPVEVANVFDDDALKEWWEPARELGFVAMTAYPLAVGDRVVGAVSFYFRDPQELDDATRRLLSTAAREMATVAESLREGSAEL